MALTYIDIDQQCSIYHQTLQINDEFFERLTLSWLYHDHALEGQVVEPQDIDRALRGMPGRNYCDRMLLHSLSAQRQAIDFIHDEAQRDSSIDLDWLRDLHRRLCPEDAERPGCYRKRQTSPGVYHLDVVPPSSVSYHAHKFIDALDDELGSMHPIRRAAFAHWEFMRLFPFDERTGQVGRLMLNFLLIKHRFPPAIIHATERQSYFDALNGHRADMVPVVTDAIRATLEAAKKAHASHRPTSRRRAAY